MDSNEYRKNQLWNRANKKTHKDLPVSVQDLLSEEQKAQIDEGLWLGNAFLITGSQGPTGKTTLTNALRKIGAIAVEPWELEEISLSKFFVPKKDW